MECIRSAENNIMAHAVDIKKDQLLDRDLTAGCKWVSSYLYIYRMSPSDNTAAKEAQARVVGQW